jgi:hypothetical protein
MRTESTPGLVKISMIRRVLAVAAYTVEDEAVLPDPGCYQELYQLTGRDALGLAVGLVSVGLGVAWRSSGISTAGVILAVPSFFAAFSVALALPGAVAVVRRMTAFRADYAGITLGAAPDNLTFFRSRALFVPWAEVERIILYLADPRGQGAGSQVQCISLQRREGAVALVPGTATHPPRRITGWQLDAKRLAAVTEIVAPGVEIIAAGTRLGSAGT